MFWIFEFAEWDLGELIHMPYLIELPDCSKMQGKILSSKDEFLVERCLCHLNIIWKLETTQIDKLDVGWLIHKDQLSQAQSSLQDNLGKNSNIFLMPLSPSVSSLTTPILPPYYFYYYSAVMGDN